MGNTNDEISLVGQFKGLGVKLNYLTRSSAVAPLLVLVIVLGFFLLFFAMILKSWIPFVFFTIIGSSVIIYFFYWLPKKTDMFVQNKYWLDYQRFLYQIGNKFTGMRLPQPEEQNFQPITKTKQISTKANIATPKRGEVIASK